MAKNGLLYATAILAAGGVGAAYLLTKGAGGTYDVTVLVQTSSGAFPGALVDLGGQVSTSDQGGVARFSGVKGGQALLTVSATGYEPYQESVTVGAASTSFTAPLTAQAGCTPTPCPCGKVYDTQLCQCSSLIPAGILMNSSMSTDLWWHIQVICLTRSMRSSILKGSSCPLNEPAWDPNDTWVIKVTGSVVDDRAHPICGALVEILLSDASLAWADGNTNGVLKFSAPSSVTTDDQGNFEADVSVTLAVQGFSGWACIPQPPSFGSLTGDVIRNVSVTARVSGTLIQGLQLLSIDNHMCEYVYPFI